MTVHEIVPIYWYTRADQRFAAEVVLQPHAFRVEFTLPPFLVPECPEWNEGIRRARVKAGRALTAMINRVCESSPRRVVR